MRDRDGVLDGTGEEIPGHRVLDGTDLEIAYNLSGDDLVLRVNKGPCQVLRVCLRHAVKPMADRELMAFNSVSPDFMFEIGATKERMLALARGVGLDPVQLAQLEEKLALVRV
jgi:hypothetical protein